MAHGILGGGMRIDSQLITGLAGGGRISIGLPVAAGVAFHADRVRPGDAFFAFKGATRHGIEFADQALDRGAAFVVSDRHHPRGVVVADPLATMLELGRLARRQLSGAVVGISGSVGKTSTRAFVAAALDAIASEGNLNTLPALASRLVDAWLTDPRRPLVLELGIDRPGEMAELVSLVRPTVGVLTRIAEGHLAALGSLAGVATEKIRLLQGAPIRLAHSGVRAHLSEELPGLVTYGMDESADITGRREQLGSGRQRISALGASFTLDLPGEGMANNALAALAVAHRLGLDPEAAAGRISRARLEPGRLQVQQVGVLTVLDDSYNSNPASLREALAVLREYPRPHAAVLGDMLDLGEHSARLHREAGALTHGLDRVIAVGPNAVGFKDANDRAVHASTVEEAVPLIEEIGEGTVLVKGSRGMRLERIVSLLVARGRSR